MKKESVLYVFSRFCQFLKVHKNPKSNFGIFFLVEIERPQEALYFQQGFGEEGVEFSND